ncbi:response regulator [Oscillatoriales cyanobacterium LEGE 11467]|uniref:Response regulator n=2 Tax=Zarconia TaxID=2992130 RepID=A0A928ZBB3_9CYAN|nr:response regulator [Zarconia navalis LEGE 11467]
MYGKAINILLVDDDAVDVMTVQRAFKKSQVKNPLYVASNGLEALEMLRPSHKSIPPSRRLVLLDLNMPKMNGIEFLKELRQDPNIHQTPVIVLTTSDREQDRLEAYNLNVAGYIVKPVTFAQVVEVMSALDRFWTMCEFPK